MPNTDASSFCDATTHQTADLPQGRRRWQLIPKQVDFQLEWLFLVIEHRPSLKPNRKKTDKSSKCTYNAVLHTKTQLKRGMRPLNNRHGDWRAVDDTQLNILLSFQILKHKHNMSYIFRVSDMCLWRNYKSCLHLFMHVNTKQITIKPQDKCSWTLSKIKKD